MRKEKKKIRVLFICLGNICRSPAAEGVLKHLVAQDPSIELDIESCGMGSWHVGREPDSRIQMALNARGIHLTSKAQQFQKSFLDHFDYILVADEEVMQYLSHYVQDPSHKSKIFYMTDFSSLYKGEGIPDPYYGNQEGFDLVLDMLEDSCQGFLDFLKSMKP